MIPSLETAPPGLLGATESLLGHAKRLGVNLSIAFERNACGQLLRGYGRVEMRTALFRALREEGRSLWEIRDACRMSSHTTVLNACRGLKCGTG